MRSFRDRDVTSFLLLLVWSGFAHVGDGEKEFGTSVGFVWWSPCELRAHWECGDFFGIMEVERTWKGKTGRLTGVLVTKAYDDYILDCHLGLQSWIWTIEHKGCSWVGLIIGVVNWSFFLGIELQELKFIYGVGGLSLWVGVRSILVSRCIFLPPIVNWVGGVHLLIILLSLSDIANDLPWCIFDSSVCLRFVGLQYCCNGWYIHHTLSTW